MKTCLSRLRMRAVAALVALVGVAAAAASAAAGGNYVALGDSYTAGPIIPLQPPPFGCRKSSNSHPHLSASRICRSAMQAAAEPARIT